MEQFGVVLSKSRTTGRQRNHANPQVTDTKDYTVLPVPRSHVKRFKGPFGEYGEKQDRFLALLLILINLSKLKQEDELHIYDAYRADLQTHEEFTLELKK